MSWVDYWTKQIGLSRVVKAYEDLGCHRVDRSLGFANMPLGYALMLDADQMYFFWLRYDELESCICWDKWSVYRGAKADSFKDKTHV